MKTLKQIIKEVEKYQCTEGIENDCELRTLTIRVDLLFDAFMLFDAHIRKLEKPEEYIKFMDDMLHIFKNLNSSIEEVQNKIGKGVGQITIYQCLQTMNMVFERKDLLIKYAGKDKEFVEAIINEMDEYFYATYGK